MVIEDINKDGNSEFIQTLLTFDYFDRMPHACSPLPAVVFAFDESSNQFVPANPRFAEYFLKDIEENIQYCQEYITKVKANPDSYDDSTGAVSYTHLDVYKRQTFPFRFFTSRSMVKSWGSAAASTWQNRSINLVTKG